MRIFLSWSGEQSQKIGAALQVFLRRVIQRTEPWFSTQSIRSGRLAYDELVQSLNGTKFGVLCITKENWAKPWLNFEAGAMLRSIDATFVTPYLLDLEPGELRAPLNMFQARKANRDDTIELCRDVNARLGEFALPAEELQAHFNMWWPDLETAIQSARAVPTEAEPPRQLTQEELLAEIRALLQHFASSARSEDPATLHLQMELGYAQQQIAHLERQRMSLRKAANKDNPNFPAVLESIDQIDRELRTLELRTAEITATLRSINAFG